MKIFPDTKNNAYASYKILIFAKKKINENVDK